MDIKRLGELSLNYNFFLLTNKHPKNIQARNRALYFLSLSVIEGIISYKELEDYANNFGFTKKQIIGLLNDIGNGIENRTR